MNFLGIGLPEMLVIFTVALLVFGPRKLPEVGRALAKVLRSLQEASREFEEQLNKEVQELERAASTPTPASTKFDKASTPTAPLEPKAKPGATADSSPQLTEPVAAAPATDTPQAADAA